MNNNLLGNATHVTEKTSQIGLEIPMKIDKSRLLFLSGDLDDMEIDPGINSPSAGSRSPVKIEMKLSETHSLKFKKSSAVSPSNDTGALNQDDMHSDCFDNDDYEGVPKYE